MVVARQGQHRPMTPQRVCGALQRLHLAAFDVELDQVYALPRQALVDRHRHDGGERIFAPIVRHMPRLAQAGAEMQDFVLMRQRQRQAKRMPLLLFR